MSGMTDFLKRLVSLNRRDCMGLAAWGACAVVAGLLCLPVMTGREVWQWKRYGLSRFEWEDVVRYGIVIAAVAGVTGWPLGLFFK